MEKNLDGFAHEHARVCILLPTAGEPFEVFTEALLAAMSQQTWPSSLDPNRQKGYQLAVLDDGKNARTLAIVQAAYELASLLRHPELAPFLQHRQFFSNHLSRRNYNHKEPLPTGAGNLAISAFFKWCQAKEAHLLKNRPHVVFQTWISAQDYNAVAVNAIKLYSFIKHMSITPPRSIDAALSESNMTENSLNESECPDIDFITNGQVTVLAKIRDTLAEIRANEPEYSKRFNISAIDSNGGITDLSAVDNEADDSCFVLCTGVNGHQVYHRQTDNDQTKCSPKAGNLNSALMHMNGAVIGLHTEIVAINLCRHCLDPAFLRRTVPYYFRLITHRGKFEWAKIAFVQTPQRFIKGENTYARDHEEASALKNLEKLDDPLGNQLSAKQNTQHVNHFAAMQYDLINFGKDAHGAVGSSGQIYTIVNFKLGKDIGFRAEVLIEDTHTSIAMFKAGWRSVYINMKREDLSKCIYEPVTAEKRIKQGKYPTPWHRVYALDQLTYFLQCIPAGVLLFMPFVYGVTRYPPYQAKLTDFVWYFTPFIVTGVLPTAIMANKHRTSGTKLARDEQIWLATAFVQFWALVTVTLGMSTDWEKKLPCYWVSEYTFGVWYSDFIAIVLSIFLALYSLWPMVSAVKLYMYTHCYKHQLLFDAMPNLNTYHLWTLHCIALYAAQVAVSLGERLPGALHTRTLIWILILVFITAKYFLNDNSATGSRFPSASYDGNGDPILSQ
eukprot:5570-Heterococcus_DN1.PRE.4